MKKLISFMFFFVFLRPLWSTEICNIKGSWKGIPEESCMQTGFVCHLGFDVNNEQNVISFYLGSDSTCQSLLDTRFKTIRVTDDSKINTLRLSLIESEEFHTDVLSMVLASSIALSASNNKKLVSVIYHQVSKDEYGGIRLQSIGIVGN